MYKPEHRLKPLDAILHNFFDELRDPNTRLPNGQPLPDHIFSFVKEEIMSTDTKIMDQLIPDWYLNLRL